MFHYQYSCDKYRWHQRKSDATILRNCVIVILRRCNFCQVDGTVFRSLSFSLSLLFFDLVLFLCNSRRTQSLCDCYFVFCQVQHFCYYLSVIIVTINCFSQLLLVSQSGKLLQPGDVLVMRVFSFCEHEGEYFIVLYELVLACPHYLHIEKPNRRKKRESGWRNQIHEKVNWSYNGTGCKHRL